MAQRRGRSQLAQLPEERIDRIIGPLARFLHVEASSGVVLLFFTVGALLLANSPLADPFEAVWRTRLELGLGGLQMSHSVRHWINDALMAVFFFVIGLEVKRELVLGELREMRKAALPIAAAIGGMIAPAGLYLSLQWGAPGESGWGIPMATDIAFVVGCLAVLGSRIPASLRVLLLSLAIADDIGAILVIAIGYTESLDGGMLLLGLLGIGAVLGLRWLGVRSVGVYVIVGALVWLAFHESGVHATIAGVMLGLLTPSGGWVSHGVVTETVQRAAHFLSGDGWGAGERREVLRQVQRAAREANSPLERLEIGMHPWVAFVIMPLFAFANAGVAIRPSDFGHPVAMAVLFGLVVGKPLGIVLVSWIAVRIGLARLPEGVGWGVLAAGGCLAGIGFTMALFIAGLALDETLLEAAKVGVLAGSAVSAVLGVTLLVRLLPRPA